MDHDDKGRRSGAQDDRAADRAPSELAGAAAALDLELRRFADLTASARGVALSSQKNIERAARIIKDAGESNALVARHLQSLVAAIGAARDRHEGAVATLEARAGEVQDRVEVYSGFARRFEALGGEARELNTAVQEVGARGAVDTLGPEGIADVLVRLEAILDRMTRIVESSRALRDEAQAAGITDLSQQAEALRQQVAAVRNKLGLFRQGLAERQPPAS